MFAQTIIYGLCLAAQMELLMDQNHPGCWFEGRTVQILKDHQSPTSDGSFHQLLQLLRCLYFY